MWMLLVKYVGAVGDCGCVHNFGPSGDAHHFRSTTPILPLCSPPPCL